MWSHVDFDAIVIGGADRDVDRRVLSAYADLQPESMSHSDTRAGRRLAGMVRASPLLLDEVSVVPLVSTRLRGDAEARVSGIVNAVTDSPCAGIAGEEARRWHAQLVEADLPGKLLLRGVRLRGIVPTAGGAVSTG